LLTAFSILVASMPLIMFEGVKATAMQFAKLPGMAMKAAKGLAKFTFSVGGVQQSAMKALLDSTKGIGAGLNKWDPAEAMKAGWEAGGGVELATEYANKMTDALVKPFQQLDLPSLFQPSQQTLSAWEDVKSVLAELRDKLPAGVMGVPEEAQGTVKKIGELWARGVAMGMAQVRSAVKNLPLSKDPWKQQKEWTEEQAKYIESLYTPIENATKEYEKIMALNLGPKWTGRALEKLQEKIQGKEEKRQFAMTGQVGFVDYAKQIQNALLRKDDPAEKTAKNTEESKKLLALINTGISNLNAKPNVGVFAP